ncbi:hypothetical protein ACIA48_01540 [Mycobacterium sp. NPDC051804]|uniref:hypothetical protein n=1 Tax=Mycobacterium sp. NPDC051804 TaxID=3364295 RepID=UPI0037B2C7E1
MDSGIQDGTEDGLDPAVVERVRRDLAELGADAASAPDVPPEVTARVVAALRAQPAHTVRRAPLRRLQVLGLVVGLGATVAGAIVGVTMLGRPDASRFPAGPTAEKITVDRPAAIPLPEPQILELLAQDPDYGPLADPQRRGSCLGGLGYPPGTAVLGARPMDMRGQPAVLMLLPGDTPEAVMAVVVEPGCSGAHTGLLAKSLVTRT